MLQSLQNVLKNKDNVVVIGSAIVVCLIGVFIGNNLHNDDSEGSGVSDANPDVVSEIIKDENDSGDSGDSGEKTDSLNDDTEKESASTDNLELEIHDITGDDKTDITSIDSSDINSEIKPDITTDVTSDITSSDTDINKINDDSATAKGISLPEQSESVLSSELPTTTTDDANKISMNDLINNNGPQQSSNQFDNSLNTQPALPQSNPFANENSAPQQGSPSTIPISSSVDTEHVDDNTAEKKPVILEETGGKNRSKKHRKHKKSKKSRKHHK
jgi:hypothetical protein